MPSLRAALLLGAAYCLVGAMTSGCSDEALSRFKSKSSSALSKGLKLAGASNSGNGNVGTSADAAQSVVGAGTVVCNEMATMSRAFVDALPALKDCMARTPAGGTLEIPVGRYLVSSWVKVEKTMTLQTQGTNVSSPVCGPGEDHQCAEFAPLLASFHPSVLPDDTYGTAHGLMQILADNVTVDRIVVNGDRAGLIAKGGWDATVCAKKDARGMLISSAYVTLQRSTIKNAMCNAGIHILAQAKAQDMHFFKEQDNPTRNLRIVYNHVFANGAPQFGQSFFFADGIVGFDTPNSVYAYNHVYDNTDVQIIIGGCKNCQIHDNLMGHTDDTYGNSDGRKSYSHGAFMAHAWPKEVDGNYYWSYIPTSGDFSGAKMFHNWIDCKGRCGIGAMFGGNQWYPPEVVDSQFVKAATQCKDSGYMTDPESCGYYGMMVFGGEFTDNTIMGAPIGIVVDDAKGLHLHGNHLTAMQGPSPLPFVTSPFYSYDLGCSRFTSSEGAIVSPFSAKNNVIQLGFQPRIETTIGCIVDYVPQPAKPAAAVPEAFAKGGPTVVGGGAPTPTPGAPGPMPAVPGWAAKWHQLTVQYPDQGPMINDAYSLCLGRLPAASEGSYWYARAGTVPWNQVYAEICSSEEYKHRVIGQAYSTCLGRGTDAAGLSYWMGSFVQGATPAQVWEAICMSEEALQRRRG